MPLLSRLLSPLIAVGMLCAIFCGFAPAAPAPKLSDALLNHKSSEQPHIARIPFDYDPILMPYIVVQASINGQPPCRSL